jgi:nitroimidazol reductase NimA-like FMN-containing flavoprotein (pyridoxamine 5'-phosphate oxidase superfamily)
MTGTQPDAQLNAGFSSPGATARPWAEVEGVLTSAGIFWLSTVRRDGRPHVTPLPTVYADGTLYFCTGDQEQKSANLAVNPRCVLTTGTPELRSGLDVVVEGTAVRVRGKERLQRLAELWLERHDWPYEMEEDGFTDGAGRTGLVFGVTPDKVLAFGKGEPFSQTRYRF